MNSGKILFSFFLFTIIHCLASSLDSNHLVRAGDKIYYIETEVNATWYDAIEFCRSYGMEAASINNEDENDKLLGHLESVGFGNLRFWTSGNDLDKAMKFVWLSTGEELNFTYWGEGQPDNTVCNNGLGVEHCLAIMKYLSPTLIWDDDLCVNEYKIICEFSANGRKI